MPDALTIWLGNQDIATIERTPKNRLRLSYTQRVRDAYEMGTPLLSLRLPVSSEPYANAVVRAFLEGLLPEGTPRLVIAEDFGLLASDTFGLISVLGADCAGAFVILPDDQPAPVPASSTRAVTPLSDAALVDLVENLRNAPLGVGSTVRLSLGGVQEKLILTRTAGGRWSQPADGAPSTHILKPGIREYPNTVENEAFCMRLARHLGLAAAHIDTTLIGNRKLLVVERYDRHVSADGSVERIHQEDFCQAFGILPKQKYEDGGGPSLRKVAGILETGAAADSLETLLRAVVLNVLIGNGDAHAKNFSLLYERPGVFRLAPLYDLLSTLVYKLLKLSMYIDSVQDMQRVTSDRLINEAASWGMSRRRAAGVIDDVLARAPAAADAAMAETIDPPIEVRAVFDAQLTRLQSTFPAVP